MPRNLANRTDKHRLVHKKEQESHIMKATVMVLSVFFVSLLPVFSIRAEDAKDSSTFTFYLENDMFADTDRAYTSGVRLTLISPDLTDYRENPKLPDWSYTIIERLPFINEPGFQRAVFLSVEQNIYTPEDLTRSDLIKDDRPYAGITYLAIGFHSKSSHRMDSLELDLGIVGPHSYAEQCQTKIHEWIDSTDPQGWDNQLEDESERNSRPITMNKNTAPSLSLSPIEREGKL